MKKLLIIGKNSYIGKNCKKYLEMAKGLSEDFLVDLVSGKDGQWQSLDFTAYDTVLMCSALVHQKEKKLGWPAYEEANVNLPVAIGQRAKQAGVGHFIFLSSIAVYGRSYSHIDKDSQPRPEGFYGQSKYLAEEKLLALETKDFGLALVRIPMVYGRHAKGGYGSLKKIGKYFPFFPKIDNQKSVISIGYLCHFLYGLILGRKRGIFHPQDQAYISTSGLMQKAAAQDHRKVWLVPFCPYLHQILVKSCKPWQRAFGDLTLDRDIDKNTD